MKVLFVCPFVPWPADDGGRIRTSNLVIELSQRFDLELFVIAPDTGAPEQEIAELRERVRGGRVRCFERSTPSTGRRLTTPKLERWFESAELRNALAERLAAGDVDLVHLDELLLSRLLPADTEVPTVLHHHKLDVEFATETLRRDSLNPRRRLEAELDLRKLRSLERAGAERHRFQVTCSEGDAALLHKRYPDLEIAAVPSGYDPSFFVPDASARREPETLLYLGHMGYAPNVDGVRWFAAAVLPLLLAARPDTRLRIVGREPAPAVRELSCDAIEVVGEVPDVRPYLSATAALVVPLRIGGGTRLKVVEGLAMGAPTVATHIGAQGLGLRDGRELRLADEAAGFAEAILELLQDPAEAARLAERGRLTVERRFRWSALADQVAEHWRRAADRAKPE